MFFCINVYNHLIFPSLDSFWWNTVTGFWLLNLPLNQSTIGHSIWLFLFIDEFYILTFCEEFYCLKSHEVFFCLYIFFLCLVLVPKQFRTQSKRDSEMAQEWRVCSALKEDLGSSPSSCVRQPAAAYNSSPKGSDAFFWSLWASIPHAHAHTWTHINMHNLN